MERYLLFMGRNQYPNGGIDDLIGDFITIEAAIEAAEKNIMKDYDFLRFQFDNEQEYKSHQKEYTWGHIYDTHKKIKVWTQ